VSNDPQQTAKDESEASRPGARRFGLRLSLKSPYPIGLAAFVLLLSIDIPLQRAIRSIPLRGFFRDLLDVAEVFGNGFGVVLVLVVIATLELRPKWIVPRIAACALGGAVAANIGKLLISRDRPWAVDLYVAHLSDTYHRVLPLFSAGSRGQSFPSAHSATAAGLAVGLAMFYPRGRWLFATLALGVGVQRSFVNAHFPSDVVAGLLLGYATARFILVPRAWNRWFFPTVDARENESDREDHSVAIPARKNMAVINRKAS
jgi:membrane-associated phospholipid phosphatase